MERYREQADILHKYLKTDDRYDMMKLPRPFIIEFTGPPSSGKTTIIAKTTKLFRQLGFRVRAPQEGAEVIRHVSRKTPLATNTMANYAMKIVVDEAHGHSHDIVILDRGLFDPYAWMLYWEEKGRATPQEKEGWQFFWAHDSLRQYIDIAYFVLCDAEVALARESSEALTREHGAFTNLETVKALGTIWKRAYVELSTQCPEQLRLIDTTASTKQEMVEQVANEILTTLAKKVQQDP